MYKLFCPAGRDRRSFGLTRRRQSWAPVWSGPPLRPSGRPGHQRCPLRPHRPGRPRRLRWTPYFAKVSKCRQRTAGARSLPRPADTALPSGLPPYALRAGRSGFGSTSSASLQMESQAPSLRGRAYARSLCRSAQQAVACRASRAPGPDGPSVPLPARAVAAGDSRPPRKSRPSPRISRRRGLPAASYAQAAVLTYPATPPRRQ